MENINVVCYRGSVYYAKVKKTKETHMLNIKIKRMNVDFREKKRNNIQVGVIPVNIARNKPHVCLVDNDQNLYAIVSAITMTGKACIIDRINIYGITENNVVLQQAIDMQGKMLMCSMDDIENQSLLNTAFYFLNGSTVIVKCKDHLFTSTFNGRNRNLTKLMSIQSIGGNITKMWLFPVRVHCGNGDESYIILLVIDGTFQTYVLNIQSGRVLENRIANKLFSIPNIYTTVINDMLLDCCTMKCSCSANSNSWSQENHTKDKFIVFVVSNKGQLLKFVDGLLCACFTIPFPDSKSLFTMTNSIGDKLYLVLSKSQQMCILDSNYKVIKIVDGISQCIIDDFVGCGSQQLLASADPFWKENDHFMLSDFALYHTDMISHSDAPNEQVNETSANSKLVGRALQSKLQTSVAELHKAEQVCLHKAALIQKSITAIKSITNGGQTCNISQASHLIPLIGHHTNLTVNNRNKDIVPMVTGDPWQRIFEENWIVGISVCNTLEQTMHSVHIFLTASSSDTSRKEEIVSSSSAFIMTEKCMDKGMMNPPTLKKARLDDTNPSPCIIKVKDVEPIKTMYLTLCTKIPQFNMVGDKKYYLTVGWTEQECNHETSPGDEQSCGERKRQTVLSYKTLSAGVVRISAKDVLTEKYACLKSPSMSGIDAKRDLVAINTCQRAFTLTLKSTYSLCSCVLDILQKQLYAPFIPKYNQYMVSRVGPLSGVRVQVLSMTANCSTVMVHARDDGQLLLLIHSLYQHLPDDIIIQPAKEEQFDNVISDVVSSLQKELIGIKTTVKRAIEETEMRNVDKEHKGFSISEGISDLEKSRAEFKSKQEQMNNQNVKMVDKSDTLKLFNLKTDLEEVTDKHVQKLGEL